MTPNIAAIVAKQLADNGPVPLDLPKLHFPRIPAAIQIIAVKHYPVYVEDILLETMKANGYTPALEDMGQVNEIAANDAQVRLQ